MASGMDGFLLSLSSSFCERSQALEQDVHMAKRGAEVEGLHERVLAEPRAYLLVGAYELAEVALLVPGGKGVPLDESVRLVPRKAGLDECEQDALAEDEPVRSIEVPTHPRGVDDQALHQPGEAVEHVVERQEGVGKDDAFCARVGDVPLVPQGNVLEPDDRRGTDDPREPGDALGDDGIALVRHRGRALLAAAEWFLHLTELRPGEMPDLGREAVEGGCRERERGEELRVAVAGNHLGCD